MQKFNASDKNLIYFFDNILIERKSCQKKVLAKKSNSKFIITNTNCSYNKEVNDTLNTSDYKLLLSKNLFESKLWAYKIEHLEYSENHIAANLRKRDLNKISNTSIGNSLSKRTTSKNNSNKLLQN